MLEKEFDIEIIRLSPKIHEYEFMFDDRLFGHFQNTAIRHGKGKVAVQLDKSERMISLSLRIEGEVELTCDRSLDPFMFPLQVEETVLYKFGEEDEDVSEALQIIRWDTERINLMQVIYDLINLAVPLKKLHPRFEQDEDEDEEDELIFSTKEEDEEELPKEEDPRWAALRKLKNEE